MPDRTAADALRDARRTTSSAQWLKFRRWHLASVILFAASTVALVAAEFIWPGNRLAVAASLVGAVVLPVGLALPLLLEDGYGWRRSLAVLAVAGLACAGTAEAFAPVTLQQLSLVMVIVSSLGFLLAAAWLGRRYLDPAVFLLIIALAPAAYRLGNTFWLLLAVAVGIAGGWVSNTPKPR